jgi:uncharacterized membrane protein
MKGNNQIDREEQNKISSTEIVTTSNRGIFIFTQVLIGIGLVAYSWFVGFVAYILFFAALWFNEGTSNNLSIYLVISIGCLLIIIPWILWIVYLIKKLRKLGLNK